MRLAWEVAADAAVEDGLVALVGEGALAEGALVGAGVGDVVEALAAAAAASTMPAAALGVSAHHGAPPWTGRRARQSRQHRLPAQEEGGRKTGSWRQCMSAGGGGGNNGGKPYELSQGALWQLQWKR